MKYWTWKVNGEKIEASVAELRQRGLLQLTRLPTATLGALQKQLRREPYHILHFVGHGGFDQQTQDGVLLLEDETGRSRLVSGNYLGTLLHDHRSLRLAVLNACEGARTHSDPFAGVAQQLVRQGIPAVIAMQFEITDKAAIILAREFYDALADGYPVSAGVSSLAGGLRTCGAAGFTPWLWSASGQDKSCQGRAGHGRIAIWIVVQRRYSSWPSRCGASGIGRWLNWAGLSWAWRRSLRSF